jgi:hypothetical protein
VSSTPDQTTGDADTSTDAIASARPVRGLMREITSHSTITKSVRLNLKPTAPGRPQSRMTTAASGFTSVPPLRRMTHVSTMSQHEKNTNAMYAFSWSMAGRLRKPGRLRCGSMPALNHVAGPFARGRA